MQQTDLGILETAIGYRFSDINLLKEALTHSSYANELKARKQNVECNERLEFLGDSVLSIVVSEFLFKKFGEFPEGELTQRRAALVRSQTLAAYAERIKLGEYLYLGRGEEKCNGRTKRSSLENAFEALLAAMYLDAGEKGFDVIRAFLTPMISMEIEQNYSPIHNDAKTELQQLIQQAEGDFLEYVTVGESGPDHDKVFCVEARLNTNVIGRGKGKSKREAEQSAALDALTLFGEVK